MSYIHSRMTDIIKAKISLKQTVSDESLTGVLKIVCGYLCKEKTYA